MERQNNIALGLANDLYVTLPAGQYKNIAATVQLNEPLKAPIIKGQSYGTIQITLNNHVLTSRPLIALTDNAKGGIWRRMSDSFSFSFNKLFSHSTEKANNG